MRFKVKPLGTGKSKVFGVYDIETGSYPLNRGITGEVKQDAKTEDEAMVEAGRLEALYAPVSESPNKSNSKAKSSTKKTVKRK